VSLRLESTEGPLSGQSHAITGIAVLGRDPQSAIVIPAPTVSREHAVVRPDEGGPGYVIEDLDSRSGTFVNGVRTRRAVLLEGDRVQIGPAIFKVSLREDALAGQVDPARLEDVPAARPQTLRMTLDAVRFRPRARDLEVGAAESVSGESKPLPGALPAAGPPETPAERLESIVELSTSLAAIHDQARLAREVARALLSFFPRARRVAIFDAVSEGGRSSLVPKLVIDRQASGGGGATSVKIHRAALEEAVAGRRAVLSEDPTLDEGAHAGIDAAGRSVLIAPLCVGENVLGALYLDAQRGEPPFDEGALRFLAGIASVVAPANENARLFARVQAETQRRALLERYFSPDMVERLLKGEVPLARDGVVKRGTILFADIRGFVRLTDATAPKVLVQTLNAYFEAMQRIVFRSRGTVERFGGDSILAYWSVIDQDPEAPRRAARAALTMQNELYRLNRELKAAGRPTITVGIGVNTGDVIAGDVGSAERYEFTVLGDAINLARRLEDLAGPGEILVGGATLAELAPASLVLSLPDRTVKGKERPVSLGALLGLRSDEPKRERWDLALGAELVSEDGSHTEARLVGLEIGERRDVSVELAAPFDLEAEARARIVVHLPACTRAREFESQGNTIRLEPAIELDARVDSLLPVRETSSPVALQRLVSSTKGGLFLLRARLDAPGPLLSALGLS
jgi:adenylate cyclase